MGTGGDDQLVYCDVPVPTLAPGEVMLKVLASSVNNTDINTRLGWYDKAVTASTQDCVRASALPSKSAQSSGWDRPSPFPFIQGTDCCGRVVDLSEGVSPILMGQRVLVRPCIRPSGFSSWDNIWLGSDFDGAFAQFVKVPASEVFPVHCSLTNAELGTIPCAYGTAENMLYRAAVNAGDHVVVTGASGGVGSAVVQLAKRRGAYVTAITSSSKMAYMKSLGADQVIDRRQPLLECIEPNSASVVIDNVAGPGFGALLSLLQRGGRYVTSGAIAGPQVTLDTRVMYLKNLSLLGCTAWAEPVFPELILAIERGEIQPCVAKTFALDQMAVAQREFLKKEHCGKFALIPPEV